MKRDGEHSKVLAIGLDGGTYTVLKPLIDAGRLPALGSMMNEGAWGILKSTIPPHTAPAWSSLATGKNPGGHGLFQFTPVDRSVYEVGDTRVANASSMAGTTIWDMLSDADRKVGIMNVPMTYPPHPVNGFMITGMLTPRSAPTFTYPPELADSLPGYRIDLTAGSNGYGIIAERGLGTSEALRSLIEDLTECMIARAETALRLMREHPCDFFFIVFTGTDRLQHYLWHCLDPQSGVRATPEGRSLSAAAEGFLVALDAQIARLFAQAGDGTTRIVVSDHGFGPFPTQTVYFNAWLMEQGFLRLHNQGGGMSRMRYWFNKIGITREMVYGLLDRVIPSRIEKQLRRKIGSGSYPIDWENTRAAYLPMFDFVGGVMVNQATDHGDSTGGASEDYESLRQDLIDRIQGLCDPATGCPVVRRVYRREEIYSGRYLDSAPDLVLVLDPRYRGERSLLTKSVVSQGRVKDTLWSGTHREEGILMLSGPDIVKGELSPHRIWDVSPTILYLLGVPVPSDMDGQIISEGIDPRRLAASPPRSREARSFKTRVAAGESVWDTEEEMEDVKDHLRGLGYL